jgi:hypothetical protein
MEATFFLMGRAGINTSNGKIGHPRERQQQWGKTRSCVGTMTRFPTNDNGAKKEEE